MSQKIKWIPIINQCVLIAVFWATQFPRHPAAYDLHWSNFLKQPDNITCGPTSCAMVIRQYGGEATVESCGKHARTEWFEYKGQKVGMTIPDYVAFCLESHGIPARLESGNIHKLKRYVSNDRPPIVLLRSGNRYWHYVVVIGYNQDKIMIADPGSGQKEELLEEVFMEAWRFSGDMQGNKVEGFDLFRYIVERIAGVSGQTMIVPGKMI